jgi:hypothetical protein
MVFVGVVVEERRRVVVVRAGALDLLILMVLANLEPTEDNILDSGEQLTNSVVVGMEMAPPPHKDSAYEYILKLVNLLPVLLVQET